MLNKTFLTVIGIALVCRLGAQPIADNDYYMMPIKPGVRNTLAGTMGELRSSHFHTGIDIRTEGVSGFEVHAAASGYISRISVSSSGYGNALYIKHPNGHTTVYAHLKEFSETVANYVRQQQYRLEQFKVNLFPESNQFIVSKGDVVALSGNSGSSGGPHLHFDVRDKNHDLLNPLQYNFEEIVDTKAPEVRSVALITKTISSRVNGEFGRSEFLVQKSGIDFVVPDTIHATGSVAVELYAFDRQNDTRFRTGISEIKMSLNGTPVFKQNIDTWSFKQSRHFYTHTNLEEVQTRNARFHKLYVDDGNGLNFYEVDANKGILQLDVNCDYTLSIEMTDTYNNTSRLLMYIKCDPEMVSAGGSQILQPVTKVIDNFLKVMTPANSELESNLLLQIASQSISIQPTYFNAAANTYLWDLRLGLPHELIWCNDTLETGFSAMVPSGKPFTYYSDKVDIQFSSLSLFDTLYLTSEIKTVGDEETFELGSVHQPFQKSATITLKPELESSFGSSVYTVFPDGSTAFVGGKWNDGNISFRTSSLGKYVLRKDSVPPKVILVNITSNQIAFQIEDEMSGIKSFNAHIEGNWLLMNYDHKQKKIWASKLDPNLPFQGEFVLEVVDHENNIQTFKRTI